MTPRPRPLAGSFRWGRRGYLALVAALLTALYGFLLTGSGFDSHDAPDVYLRVHQYVVEFAAHRLPQSFPDVVGGGGYAFPRFYPPLAYYITAAIYPFTRDVIWAVHLSLLMSVLVSGVSLSWGLMAFGVGPRIASLAGLAYSLLPYRLTVVAARGALAESWAMAWLPVLLVGSLYLVTGKRRGRVLVPLAFAGLLLTHTAVALWMAPPVILVSLVAGSPPWRQIVLALSRGMLLGVALAAWYLLPMWWYLPTVWASNQSIMLTTAEGFAAWGVPFTVLFGGGLYHFVPDSPMRLSVGSWGLILPPGVFILLRQSGPSGSTMARRLSLACGVLWLLAIGVVLAPSLVVGVLPQPLLYLQFPYRLIGLAGLLGASGLAWLVSALREGRRRSILVSLWGGAVLLVTTTDLALPRPAQVYQHNALVNDLRSQHDGLTVRYEYFPRTTDPTTLGRRVEDAERRLRAAAGWVDRAPGELRFSLRVATDTVITLPLVAYDFVDVRDQAGAALPMTAIDGLVAVALSRGHHQLAVGRRVPWPYWAGAVLALSGLLLTLVGVKGSVRRNESDEQGSGA